MKQHTATAVAPPLELTMRELNVMATSESKFVKDATAACMRGNKRQKTMRGERGKDVMVAVAMVM